MRTSVDRITQLLQQANQDHPRATEELFPLLYHELRKLAVQKMARENSGLTLQATALVHEVYLRLLHGPSVQQWNSRYHFYAAAAEAMRRILIEGARRRNTKVHGGDWQRCDLTSDTCEAPQESEELLALDEALDRLALQDAEAAELVKLRFFAGLTNVEAAAVMGISARKAVYVWSYARAWLRREMER